MVKRTLSFVLALTVLVSCLMGIPVMATTADVITDITAGGEYAVKTIMSADDLFKAANFSANGITATRESGKTAITFDANARYNNDITLADFSNVDLSEAMAPGKRVVSLTGTVNLSRLPEAYKLDGYKKIYENFGFGILATTSENATLQYGRFASMRVRSTDDTEKDEETGVETTNGKYNVYVGDPALAIISDDWTQPDTIELKWDFIFTDNAANDGSKDITLQVSGRKQGATEWVVYTPCEANEEEGIAARVLPVKTVPAGKNPFKNIKMSYSVNGSPLTEEGASTGVTGLIAGIKDPLTMTLGGFDMVMEAKNDAAISDLGGKSYEAGAVVPFSFVLPEGYKSAKISVGGQDVKTLDNAAGAYKANLNLSEVSAVGEVEITLSGVGADDATFSKTTKIYVPSATSGSLNTALLTQPVPGGVYQDTVLADNLDILGANAENAVANGTTRTYTAATEANPVATMTFTNDTSNLGNATLSSQIEGVNDKRAVGSTIELAYDVTVIGGNPTSTPNQYFGFSLGTYFGSSSGDTYPTYSGWNLLTTRAGGIYVNGSKILDHDKESATGTTVSIKNVYEILSETSVKCTMYYKKADGTWAQGASQTKTVTDTRLRTIKAWQWMNKTGDTTAACTITYKLSNASLKELGKKTAAIADLSGKNYLPTDTVAVDFVLPEGYRNAELIIGSTKAAAFEGEITKAGAYTATINMAEVKQEGDVPVVLSGSMVDGTPFTQSTKIYLPKSSASNDGLLSTPVIGGYWYNRVVMDNEAFLNRAYTPSSVTYAYDSDAKTASMIVSTSDNYKKFLDLTDLEMNTETSGEVEVYMTVQPTKVSDEQWFPSQSTSSYWCLYLDSYIDGTRVQGAVDKWKGLTTKYTTDGVKVYFPNNGAANPVTWSETTKIPMKFVITKVDGELTMKHYADLGNGWVDGGTNLTSTAASGALTGLGFRFGSNSKDGQIKYIISDTKIVEKTPQTARLKAFCDDESAKAGKAIIDFVLPVGFREAELTIDGVQAAFFGADATAGAYTADVKLNAIDKDSVSVIFSGVMADGSEFTKNATFSIPKLGAGSLDEEIFSEPTYSADKIIMDSESALNRGVTGFTYSYDPATKSATLNNGGAYQTKAKLFDFPKLRLNETQSGSLEINMNVEVKPGSGTEFPTGTGNSAWSMFALSPYIDGTAVEIANLGRYDAGILTFVTAEYAAKDTQLLSWSRLNYSKAVSAVGNKVPVKILVTKDANGITWTQQAKFGDEWVTNNPANTTYTGNGNLTGMRLWIGQNSADASNYVAWNISDVSVVEHTDFTADLSDLSKIFYTQKDTGNVPVKFILPTGYREANILLDGKAIAEFTSSSHLAGNYKSEIALEKLGIGEHEVKLIGKMADGTAFEKATSITIYAATEGADVYALELEEPEMATSVSGGTRSEYSAQTAAWPTYNANTNPNGPFLSQYVVELGADVDFTNGIPGIYLTGNRAQEGSNYNFGEFFNITNLGQTAFMMADGSSVAIPQKKFNLTFRIIIDRPESGYGDIFNIYVYIDGNYAGLVQKTNASYSLGDLYGALSIGFRTKEANAPVSVSKLTWKKYSTISASAELESAKKVVVTFNKDMAEMSDEFITLVDKAGNPVAAEVVVSGKTATITAASDIPAYASVKIGTGVKEADYEFRAYTGTSESTKTRLGEALSQGFEIALGNKPTKTAVYGMTAEKDGNNIVTEVELYALAPETIGKLVVAGYDDNGVMQGIDIQDVATEEEGEAILTLTAEFDGAFASYKVFLWSDIDGAMTPVLAAKPL